MNDFHQRVLKCSQNTREMLAFLTTVAENAGHGAEAPTFDGVDTGITYRREGKRFCRFDPKFGNGADHVFACIPDADRGELEKAGTVATREDGPWVIIEDMRGAVRLVPEILRAYDRRGPRTV